MNEDLDKNNQVGPAPLARVRAFSAADLFFLVTISDFIFFLKLLVRTGKVEGVFCTNNDGGGFFLITRVICLSPFVHLIVLQLFIIHFYTNWMVVDHK